MKQEARRKNLPGKIWDVLYPTAALVLCMLIVTMAALMLAGWITGKQSADSRELMEAVPGLSLWVSGGLRSRSADAAKAVCPGRSSV